MIPDDYRVYDKANKRYMDVVQICFHNPTNEPWLRTGVVGMHNYNYVLVDWVDAVLERCTGMKDTKDRLIYEGHVVRGIGDWQEWDHAGVVEYSSNLGSFVLNLPGNRTTKLKVLLADYDMLKILGNYAEDPDRYTLAMPFYGDKEDDDADKE